jgi:hypothetical protein
MNEIYGRITATNIAWDMFDYTLEVFDGSGVLKTYNALPTIQLAEEWFHFVYPTGYIIPDWMDF